MSRRLPEQKTADGVVIIKGMVLWVCVPEEYPVYGPRIVDRPNDGNNRVRTTRAGYPSPCWCYVDKNLALIEAIKETEKTLARLKADLAAELKK